MKIMDRANRQIENQGNNMKHKFRLYSGLVLVSALLCSAGSAMHGQNVQNPPPAPQVAPHPQPEPEVAPEPPEPPEPPESFELDPSEASQVFVLNDGAPHLGVTLSDVTEEKAQELKLPAVAGAIVTSVQKGSAAAKAGLETGDTIMEFDGVRVRSSAELRRLIRETPAGRTVEMKIVREGQSHVLSAMLEASRDHYGISGPEIHIPPINVPEINIPPINIPGWGDHRASLGISADDLTPQLAQYFGVKQGKGVLISEVTLGGAADKAGLKAGDVIVRVDGKPVSGVEELRDALNDNFTGDTRKVSLTFVRDRREQTVNADLTRSHTHEKRTSDAGGESNGVDLAELPAQLGELRAAADQLRALADGERNLEQAKVQQEVFKQQKQLQGEWQRQFQEQMRALKEQLKQLENLPTPLHQDGQI